MILESKSIKYKGTGFLGNKYKIGVLNNYIINIFMHIIIPYIILVNINYKLNFEYYYTLIIELLGLFIFDIKFIYPSKNPINLYIYAHVFIVIICIFFIKNIKYKI